MIEVRMRDYSSDIWLPIGIMLGYICRELTFRDFSRIGIHYLIPVYSIVFYHVCIEDKSKKWEKRENS